MRQLGILFAGALTLLCRPALALDGKGAVAQAGQQAKVSQENVALATRHFDEAMKLFRAGKFNEARIEFEASFALTGEVDLLDNLSLTAERQGKLGDAIEFEERFLAAKPASLTQRDIDEARGRIARLREQLSRVGTMPQPVPTTDRASTFATERRRVPPGAIGLLVLGSAVVVVGIGCGAGAFSTARTIDGMPLTVAEADALTSRGQALDRAGIALDVIGAAALVAGTTWAVWKRVHARKTTVARTEVPLAPPILAWSNREILRRLFSGFLVP